MIMISMMSIDHDHNFNADQEDHHHDYHVRMRRMIIIGVMPIHPSLLKLLNVFSVLCGGATSLSGGILYWNLDELAKFGKTYFF